MDRAGIHGSRAAGTPRGRLTRDAHRSDAAAVAILYATPKDAANAARLSPHDRLVTSEIEYTRAKVGRWHYDGKVSRIGGGTPTFGYRDRKGRERTTDLFTLVS